jgi:PAS domain S-box-containing protein
MNGNKATMNIALIGGRTYCREVLEKIHAGYIDSDIRSRIAAVSDPNPDSPGMVLAREMGLKTFADYYELYKPENEIDLIIFLTPDASILEDVLATRPDRIRVMAYHTFELFWKAIGVQEQKLRDRNEEVETILNGIEDFILVIAPDKKIIDVNDPFLKKMGFARDEVIGKTCTDVWLRGNPPCLKGDSICPLNEVVRNKGPHVNVLTRSNRNGERRYIEVSVYPIWETNGKISKFIEISRDITVRRQEEQQTRRKLEQMVAERTRQLKETHEKLIHQDKMASLGKLSASVVHEINNPIAGILNLILLIRRVISEGPVSDNELSRFEKYLELMESETRRISRIVSNLLAFSRQSKMEMLPININQLVEKVLLLNSNLLKINDIKLEKYLDDAIPDANGSEDQLQQVFMNLLSNAAEAMENRRDSVLTITTSYAANDGKILVSFSDKGVGIPAANLSKLFEPFFTTKKKSKGVGLGLSVAYGIVEEHKGAIHVVSKEGSGTKFVVELPVAPSAGRSRKGKKS